MILCVTCLDLHSKTLYPGLGPLYIMMSCEQLIFPKVMWNSLRHGFGLLTRITRKPKSFTYLAALGRVYRMTLSTHHDVLHFHHCGIHAWCTSCPWHARIVRSCWEGDRDILLPHWLWGSILALQLVPTSSWNTSTTKFLTLWYTCTC